MKQKRVEIRSVTSWLQLLKSKQWNYFNTNDYRDTTFQAETINPAPRFIDQKRWWGLFGAFTDYVIRKFFRDKLIAPKADIVPEKRLIAEISLQLLSPRTIKHTHKLSEIRYAALGAIERYKKETWKKTIADSWLLSNLDVIYRRGHIRDISHLSKEEEKLLEKFLEETLKWLQRIFSMAKKIYLNPSLGIPNLIKADADFIIDNTIWDIKCTKYPNKAPSSEVNQLLAYTSLVHFHSKKSKINYPSINRIGFLFPQQLSSWERKLDEFSASARENMLKKLILLAQGKMRYS